MGVNSDSAYVNICNGCGADIGAGNKCTCTEENDAPHSSSDELKPEKERVNKKNS